MKIFAYIASVVVTATLIIAGAFALGLTQPRGTSPWLTLVVSVAMSGLIIAPLLVGSLTAYWNVTRSEEGRRAFRRWFIGVVAVDAAAAVVFTVGEVVAGGPGLLIAVIIAVAAALMITAFFLGRALLRFEERHGMAEAPAWVPIPTSVVARRVSTVVFTFVIALVVGVILVIVVAAILERAVDGVLLLSAAGLAFLAAAVACILVTLPLSRTLRASIGTDFGLLRKLGKVVLANSPLALNDAESVAATKYAQVLSITLPFQLGYLVLLYIGIGLTNVQLLFANDSDGLPLVVLGFLAATLVGVVPYLVIRIRRVQRYAREHPVAAAASV